MKTVSAFGSLVLAILLAGYVILPSSLARAFQSNPTSGVLTLDDTMTTLGRLISRSRVTVTAKSDGAFADPAGADHGALTNSNFQFDRDLPCLITFDEVASFHFTNDASTRDNAGRTVNSGERHFIWLPAMDAPTFAVVDLKTWANDDDASDSSVPAGLDAAYTGFVLITKHSSEVIAVAPLKKHFPNPSSYSQIREADRIFFTNRSDAEDAKKLLAHATSVTRTQSGAQHCVRR
jgi:hypothetical protein